MSNNDGGGYGLVIGLVFVVLALGTWFFHDKRRCDNRFAKGLRRSDATAGRSRTIPVSEMWLWQDGEALASLFQGIAEAGRGDEVVIDLSDLEVDDD